ncbi:MAG: thiamine pyrophosphate-dependent enzyme, partial [Planctomycetes bacterium]|nr:thiamine pyrophosphate-dependent enzyme [Planctomycetota bacterium]
CFNRARTVLQSQADVVLVLGARLNWVFRHGAELAREATVFRVDIHPDEEEDVAIETRFIRGDAGDFLHRMLRFLDGQVDNAAAASRKRALGRWLAMLRDASNENQRWLDTQASDDSRPMSPYRMMKEIQRALPREAICITDGNISMLAAQPLLRAFQPASRMDAGTNGCMGVGVPFAIGAKVARPERPVLAIVGDYGFSLSAMEMEVCVRHKIPIVVIVANNQGNCGAIKQKRLFSRAHAERVTMFQPGLEYDRMMKTFGGNGTTITDPHALTAAITAAVASDRPCCINVVIDPNMPTPNAWGKQFPIAKEGNR